MFRAIVFLVIVLASALVASSGVLSFTIAEANFGNLTKAITGILVAALWIAGGLPLLRRKK